MNIKGSKIGFAFNTALAVACVAVSGGLIWQLATLDLELSEQASHGMGAFMGIAWAIVMGGHADCNRRGISLTD